VTIFSGTQDDDIFTGSTGADTIAGAGGADSLSGGDGNDTIYSANVSPVFTIPYYSNTWTAPLLDQGTERDTLSGGSGDDSLFAGYGDNVSGGAGFDTLYISFQGAPAGVVADFRLSTLSIGGGTITGIETIGWVEGSNFADQIIANGVNANFAPIFGMGGDDHIVAGYYTGNIYGGDGNDILDNSGASYGFQLYGEAGDDILIGGSGYERLDGGDGNDAIQGNYGYDALIGGNGDDMLDGGSFGDTLDGGSGNDTLYGAGDADVIYGGGGNDVLYGDFSLISSADALTPLSNNDLLFGGAGADILRGDQGDDILGSGDRVSGYSSAALDDLGTEHDQLFGGHGDDILSIGFGDDADGGSGTDRLSLSLAGATAGQVIDTSGLVVNQSLKTGGGTIQSIEILDYVRGSSFGDTFLIATQQHLLLVNGADGNDTLTSKLSSVDFHGGNGDDRFISGAAADYFDGEAGIDTIDYRNALSGVTVMLGLIDGQAGSGAGGDSLLLVENIDSSAFDDSVTGSDGINILKGMAGHDTLNGKGGSDILIGGAGNDQLQGGNGNDALNGGTGNDMLDGGAGMDGAVYDTIASAVSIDLSKQAEFGFLGAQNTIGAGLDTLTGIENVTGTSYADTLIGSSADNLLTGGGGHDQLSGNGGNDILLGGSGNDLLIGGIGHDILDGGTGVDTLDYSGIAEAVTVKLGATAAQNTISAGMDTLINIENLIGTGSNDALTGSSTANRIEGGGGADKIDGGAANDVIIGGDGNDRLTGSAGADQLWGGTGTDLFVFGGIGHSTVANQDTIFDFSHADGDKIDLSVIDANSTLKGNSAFTLVSAFSGQVGQLVAQFDVVSASYAVGGDVNGDGIADFAVQVFSNTPLIAADFIL
jgi:Ca2+-binding RTX toxin-like protein